MRPSSVSRAEVSAGSWDASPEAAGQTHAVYDPFSVGLESYDHGSYRVCVRFAVPRAVRDVAQSTMPYLPSSCKVQTGEPLDGLIRIRAWRGKRVPLMRSWLQQTSERPSEGDCTATHATTSRYRSTSAHFDLCWGAG